MAFNLGSIFGSSSQSEQSTSTSNSFDIASGQWGVGGDLRDNASLSANTLTGTKNVSQGAGSISAPVEVSGTGNTVTTTDYASVSKSLDAMVRGVEQSTALATLVAKQAGDQQKLNISTGSDLLNNVLSSTKKQADELTTAVVDLKTSDVRVLVIGALAIVGAVVAVMMKKG